VRPNSSVKRTAFRGRLLQALAAMDNLWGPISANEWRNVPCVSGRPATEADVVAGAAVFYVPTGSAAATMQLPCCAILLQEDGSEQQVIVIQAELAPGRDCSVLGVRPLSGGNVVCTMSEVTLLPSGFAPICGNGS
jgi:hypothetical protein